MCRHYRVLCISMCKLRDVKHIHPARDVDCLNSPRWPRCNVLVARRESIAHHIAVPQSLADAVRARSGFRRSSLLGP